MNVGFYGCGTRRRRTSTISCSVAEKVGNLAKTGMNGTAAQKSVLFLSFQFHTSNIFPLCPPHKKKKKKSKILVPNHICPIIMLIQCDLNYRISLVQHKIQLSNQNLLLAQALTFELIIILYVKFF